MITKIQNLNGTHNLRSDTQCCHNVVYDYKDTKFEWNSQHTKLLPINELVVYDYKDTKFEWNSQRKVSHMPCRGVVYDYKDTKFEWNSQPRPHTQRASQGCL